VEFERRVRAEREAARRVRLDREVKRVIPPLYRETDRNRLPRPDLAERVTAWKYGPRGLILGGKTGTGKSRAMYLLLMRLLEEGHSIEGGAAVEWADRCSEVFSTRDGNGPGWMRRLTAADVWFLDDLGKQVFTERGQAAFYGLVESRIARKKPIIVTIKMTGDELAEKMSADRGEPTIRRLYEFCEVIDFGGGL